MLLSMDTIDYCYYYYCMLYQLVYLEFLEVKLDPKTFVHLLLLIIAFVT